MTPNILLIDNYDSFAHNVARYTIQLGCQCQVVRNDEVTLSWVETVYRPSHIIISPGPCTPNEAGISLELIERLHQKLPILGICLGHQAIGQVFGGKVARAKHPMHGQASPLNHTGNYLFNGIENNTTVGRYHSLIVEEDNLSPQLQITARSQENEIMAFSHQDYPLHGVQFHPESILTTHGYDMLRNFINAA